MKSPWDFGGFCLFLICFRCFYHVFLDPNPNMALLGPAQLARQPGIGPHGGPQSAPQPSRRRLTVTERHLGVQTNCPQFSCERTAPSLAGGIPNSSSIILTPRLTTWAPFFCAVVLPMWTMLSPKGVQNNDMAAPDKVARQQTTP